MLRGHLSSESIKDIVSAKSTFTLVYKKKRKGPNPLPKWREHRVAKVRGGRGGTRTLLIVRRAYKISDRLFCWPLPSYLEKRGRRWQKDRENAIRLAERPTQKKGLNSEGGTHPGVFDQPGGARKLKKPFK